MVKVHDKNEIITINNSHPTILNYQSQHIAIINFIGRKKNSVLTKRHNLQTASIYSATHPSLYL